MLRVLRNTLSYYKNLEKNCFLFMCEGAAGAIVLNLTNPFFSMFAKRMGAGDFQISLVSSLPALVGILALIPGALIVDKQSDKKNIVALLLIITAFMYPLAAMSTLTGSLRVYAFIVIIALLNWPLSVFNISWQSFFSDVLTLGNRTLTYTGRSKVATFLGVVTVLAAGLILSYLPRTDVDRIRIYQVFFFAAFFLALLQTCLLRRINGYSLSEKAAPSQTFITVTEGFRDFASNKPLLTFTAVSFLFHITWQMAWPLFFLYQVDFLHANEAWLSYVGVANGLAGVATYSFWGRMIQKKGSKWVLVIGGLGLAVNPILLISTNSLYIALVFHSLVGLTFSGFQLALFENLMEVVPKRNKTLSIAIYTTLTSISGFVSPMLGVGIYKLTSIYFAMILSGILRFGVVGLFYLRYRRFGKSRQSILGSSMHSNKIEL